MSRPNNEGRETVPNKEAHISSHCMDYSSTHKNKYATSSMKGNIKDMRDILQLVFKTEQEAYIFYFNYGRDLGFDVCRYSKKTDKYGFVKNREWICSFAGFRQSPNDGYVRRRRATPDLRCRCKASFRVSHDRFNGLYKVTKFIPNHNHPLATVEIAHFLKCNRYISTPQKALLSGLTASRMRACKAMNYLEHIECGLGKLHSKRKDGYNFLYKQKIESTQDGDVNTTIALLKDLQIHDKYLIFDFTLDVENVLTRLFWIDGMSRAQFKVFGDVLLFDNTYKTNEYRFPLVILSGVDNHFKTCVFGVAILYSERVESYSWLLQKFKQAVGGAPSCVLTDQDAAMRAAIKAVYPEAKHRICSWHLERNALRNVGKRRFLAEFGDLITTHYNVEDFEVAWQNLIQKHNVADHPWVLHVYKEKECWKEAHCRGYFMAMMTSTQRAELMNSYLKLDVNPELNLCDLLKHFHICLGKMRASFLENQIAAERYIP